MRCLLPIIVELDDLLSALGFYHFLYVVENLAVQCHAPLETHDLIWAPPAYEHNSMPGFNQEVVVYRQEVVVYRIERYSHSYIDT